ncbi:phage tail tape measure protein [Caballeronia sp. S22]|uniref:phage tail tape measure protein n=1 Tax=Caballeronia sp. S22 TaxID=3137182 RepID=UPI0035316AD7
MADSFQLKAILSAVDKISPTLQKVRTGINATHKTFRDLGGASRGLLGSIGLPAAISFGAIGFAALHAAQGALEYAGALQDASDKTGVAIGPLQSLQTVFEASGVSSEDFIESVTKLNKGLAEAGAGKDASLLGLLTKLRIPLRDAKGQIRSVESVLPQLADALAKNENPAVRTRIAMELFGKAGAKMIATLKNGGKALIDAQEDAKRLGAVLSDEATGKLDDLGDSFGLISRQIKVQLAAAFAVAAPSVMAAVKAVSEWIGANKELLQQKIGGYIERIAKAFQGWVESGGFEKLGSAIVKVVDGIDHFITSVGGLRNVLMGIGAIMLIGPVSSGVQLAAVFLRIGTYVLPFLGTALLMVGRALFVLNRAFLVNPIVAAVAAIAEVAYLIYDNWGTIGPWMAKLWEGVKTAVVFAFDVIKAVLLNFTPLGLIVKNWEPIVTYFSGLWGRVKGFIDPILNAGRTVLGAIGGFFSGPEPSPARAGANVLQQTAPPAASQVPAASGVPPQRLVTPQTRGPLANVLTGQPGQTKLNGELVVRFQDAPPGTRVDPGTSNQPGLSINPDVGYRSQLAF